MADLGIWQQALHTTAGPDGVSAIVTTSETEDLLFAEGEGSRRVSKRYHKKSRKGCQRCRARRVKCDEIHPICGSCEQHEVTCIYDRDKPKTRSAILTSDSTRRNTDVSDAGSVNTKNDTDSDDLLETKSRRMLELKLLHHYNTKMSQTMLVSGDQTAADVWIRSMPNLAFENGALLHAMYALSALHMAEAEPDDLEIIEIHRRYLVLALREHNRDVSNLNEKNFDAVCMTSSLLRIKGFAMLRVRPLVPYEPPALWLDMTRGAMNLFKEAWKWIGNDEDSFASRLTRRMPLVFDDEAKFAESNRADFLHLLHRNKEDIAGESWSADVQEAYETTISYIGCIWIAMKAKELPAEICRRLILFPFLIQGRFIELAKEEKPRALAVLAHYFVLLGSFRNVWWIGESGPREFNAINRLLSGKRPDLIGPALQFVDESNLYP